jgi:tetratricopeptide (TPR) repeat protein
MTSADNSELLVKGRDAFSAGNYIEARAYFEDLLKIDPESEQAKNLLAMTFVKLENYSSAINVFKQLLRNNPEEINILLNLGAAYLKSDKPADAIKIFQKIVEIDPSHTSAHNYMGMAYAKKNLFEKAIIEFKKSGNQKMVDRMKEKINERIKKKKTEKKITSVDLLDETESQTPPPIAAEKIDKPPLPPPDSNFETFNDDTFFPADKGQIAESFFEDSEPAASAGNSETKSDLPPLPDFDTDFPIDPSMLDKDIDEKDLPATTAELPLDTSDIGQDAEEESDDTTDFPIDPSAPTTAPPEPPAPPETSFEEMADLPATKVDSDLSTPPAPIDLGLGESSTAEDLFPDEEQSEKTDALAELQNELESNTELSEPTEETNDAPQVQVAPTASNRESPLVMPFPKPITELTRNIEIDPEQSRIWQLDTGAIYCCPSPENSIFVRENKVVAVIGDLTGEPVKKMFKGKEMKSLFGGKKNHVARYAGDGIVLTQPSEAKYSSLIRIADDEIYIKEANVLAFESNLKWQNGRLQLEGFSDLDLVFFSGEGVIAIESPHRFNAIEIDGTQPFVATIDNVVGWMGKVSPELISPKQDKQPPLLKFTGKGSILI